MYAAALWIKLFLAQFIVALIIIFVLKKILDKILVENAIRSLSFWQKDEESPPIIDVSIISHKKLAKKYQDEFVGLLTKKCGKSVQLKFLIDRSMLGGVIIHVGERHIQFSLKERLKIALNAK